MPGTEITEKQAKYCRCVLHVMAKNSSKCNSKNWGSGKCYNPYAVCAKSVGTSYRYCGKTRDWEKVPKDEIIAYLRTKNVKISSDTSKSDALKRLRKWKNQNE